MHSWHLALPGSLSLRITHPQPVFDDAHARLLLSAYLPGVAFTGTPGGKVDLTVAFQESGEQRLTRKSRRVTLSGRWSGTGSLLDLIFLTYSASRLLWLRRNLYPLHSCCLGADGYVLVLGHSGAGKTSIALNMAACGQKVFSANKTLVSMGADRSMTALAGTRTITTTAEDAARHLGARIDLLGYQNRSAWSLPDDLYAPVAPVPVRLIAVARLNDGGNRCERLSPASAVHRLHPWFLDAFNANTVLPGAVFCGTPPRGCEDRLRDSLVAVTAKIPVLMLSGSMEFVSNALEERYDV